MPPQEPSLGTSLTRPYRIILASLVLVAAGLALAVALVRFAPALRLELGPGDHSYVQGLSSDWRWETDAAWRSFERRSRLSLPVTVAGGGSFSLEVSSRATTATSVRVHFDDGTAQELTLAPASGARRISFALPSERVRAYVRVRVASTGENATVVRVSAAEWKSPGALPQPTLMIAVALLVLTPFLAGVLAGASLREAMLASAFIVCALVYCAYTQPFAALHLALASTPVVFTGLVIIALVRVVGPRLSPAFLVMFFFALLFRAGLLFHPSFYFYDLQVHETLVELIYHRGMVDFWSHWPDYQVQYGIGVSLVEGVRQSLLYPVMFHFVAHAGNSLVHAPVFWIKMVGAVFAALGLFPLGYLARRLSSHARADVFAGALYLLVPSLTRSLFSLKLAATMGHFVDLCVVAYLAHISLRLDSRARLVSAVLLTTASLVSYNSGFMHMGLLIGACLMLAPLIGGLDRPNAFRLAAAGLAALPLAVVCYHPSAVRAFWATMLGQGDSIEPTAAELDYSVTGMALEFVGAPLIVIGCIASVIVLPRLESSIRLLVSAWLGSAAIAFGLRYVFPEMLTYQKELYWAGAAFAVVAGTLLAQLHQRGRWGSAVSIAALVLAGGVWLWSFYRMLRFFYGPYLFL